MANKPTTLAKIESTQLDPQENSALYEAYANAGMEHVTARDLIIPRVTILQGLSPQVNKTKAEYVKGAEVGQIIDLGTNHIYGEKIAFIPVFFNRRYLEWWPRASGKGLAKIHDDGRVMEECVQNDKNQSVLANGNIVNETAQFFGLVLAPTGARRCFIPMQSTQLKKSRRLLSFAQDFKLPSGKVAPLFYSSYDMSVVAESNSSGDWIGWKIEVGQKLSQLPNSEALFKECVSFLNSLKSGEAKADDSGLAAEAGPDEKEF